MPSYELFSAHRGAGPDGDGADARRALDAPLPVGLEPVGEQVESRGRPTSKSAVSRRFVAATETALAELLAADLSGLDLVALMIDGVHFGEHLCVVALGIGIDGIKHPLALEEGSTENATLVTDLLVGLRERGLDVTRPILVVLDGAKALRRAVQDVFDHPVIARCQLHKIRNVRDRLPEQLAPSSSGGCARPTTPTPRWPPKPSSRPGRGTRPHPPRCRGQPARRPGRDAHRAAPGRATHPGRTLSVMSQDIGDGSASGHR